MLRLSETLWPQQVKPSLFVIANVDVGIADVINDLACLRSLKCHNARIISAHIKWLVLLFFIHPSVCHATLIVTACAPDRVIIAADGLMLKPGQTPPSAQGCKIIQGTDTCFISIAGFPTNANIHFDMWSIASRSCRGSGSIIERAKTFQNLHRLLLGAIALEADPKKIGPPIAILEISGNGAKWIERGACAEIKHHAKPGPPTKAKTQPKP